MPSHARHGHSHPSHDSHVSGPAWLPVALAILLGTAAMVAGLIAWRAAGHSGEAQKAFALSTQANNKANSLQQNTSQDVINERSLFIAYEDGVFHPRDCLALATRREMRVSKAGDPCLSGVTYAWCRRD
jgi:hypothetical protein